MKCAEYAVSSNMIDVLEVDFKFVEDEERCCIYHIYEIPLGECIGKIKVDGVCCKIDLLNESMDIDNLCSLLQQIKNHFKIFEVYFGEI